MKLFLKIITLSLTSICFSGPVMAMEFPEGDEKLPTNPMRAAAPEALFSWHEMASTEENCDPTGEEGYLEIIRQNTEVIKGQSQRIQEMAKRIEQLEGDILRLATRREIWSATSPETAAVREITRMRTILEQKDHEINALRGAFQYHFGCVPVYGPPPPAEHYSTAAERRSVVGSPARPQDAPLKKAS